MRRIAVIAVVALASLAATASSALASATTITYHADGTANDVSGTHDGTWFGTPAYAAGSTGAAGDESFSFNGSNYISADPSVGTFGTDEATISFDVRTSSPYSQALMADRRYCDNPPEGWWQLGMRGAADPAPGHMTAEFGGGGMYTQAISTTAINDGRLHHVVVHRDNSGVSVSIDGVREAFSPGPPANINPYVPFQIGHSPCPIRAMTGTVDEINITRGSPMAPTSTSVSCSPAAVVAPNSTTCTATVSDTSTPTGSVSFTSSGSGSFSNGGSCALSGSGGSASCSVTYTPGSTPATPVRSDSITANYGGDAGHTGSSGSASVSVTSLPASTDQCKKGGWQQYGVFKNQGDCVSYVATGGTNLPG